MKKFILAMLLVLAAGAASATNVWTVVWEEPFDSDTLTDPADNPVTISDANDDTWLEAAAVWNGGLLRHLTGGSGQNRGVAIVLNPANHPLMVAGDYTFAFDLVSMYANCTVGVTVYDGARDAGTSPANTYKLDLLSTLNAPLAHETVGAGGDLTALTNATYVQADVGTNKAVSFAWDGTGDMVLVFDLPLTTNWTQRAELDNMSLGAYLPESTNNPPTFIEDPFSAGDATEETAYSNTISGSATDNEGDPLTYSKDAGPEWLNIGANGALSGTPAQAEVGTNVFTVRVSDDAGAFDTATLTITVLNEPDPPVFALDPIDKPSAFVDTAYSNSIAFTASDAEGDTLTYSKISGPTWLNIVSNGLLSGTPASSDLGENTFTVQVNTQDGSDTAAMSIHVVSEPAWCGKPNILYILADDLGYNDLSIHGQTEFPTPNIDSVFSGGLRFQAALVGNSVCAPSRAALLTGRSGSRFGFEANIPHAYASLPGSTIGLDTNQVTLADVLKPAGYKTYAIGKWHLGDNDALFHPNLRGFDEFYGMIGGSRSYFQLTNPADRTHDKVIYSNQVEVVEPVDLYMTDFLTEQALRDLTTQTLNHPQQPWFMYMSYTAPHGPMHAKAADLARVAHTPAARYSDAFDKEMRRVYAAMVLSLDDNVGRLLNRLGALDIVDRTLIIFHSDNGGPLASGNWSDNAPLKGQKGQLWEGGIRVPFGIQWPGTIPAGQVAGHGNPMSALDMMPTLAAVSCADQLQEVRTDGVNLMPLLTGRIPSLPPRTLHWRRGTTSQIAVRSGDWKYYRNRNTGDDYLFEHSTDALEWSNEAAGNPAKVAELAAGYAEYEATIPDPHWNVSGELLAITTYDLEDAVTNQFYTMALSGSPAGESVTWTMTNAPAWLSLNPLTGELSGMPSPADPTHNTITLQIDNGVTNSTYTVPLRVVGGYDPNDTDADGLPDAWETNQFASIAVTAGGPEEDQDGDGSSDRSEYIEGTSAGDSNSCFRTPLTVTDTTFSVSFAGVTNRSYVLHTTTNLANGVWLYADNIENLQSNETANLRANLCGDSDALFGRIKVEVD